MTITVKTVMFMPIITTMIQIQWVADFSRALSGTSENPGESFLNRSDSDFFSASRIKDMDSIRYSNGQ